MQTGVNKTMLVFFVGIFIVTAAESVGGRVEGLLVVFEQYLDDLAHLGAIGVVIVAEQRLDLVRQIDWRHIGKVFCKRIGFAFLDQKVHLWHVQVLNRKVQYRFAAFALLLSVEGE